MKYIAFSFCFIVGISTSYLALLSSSPDVSDVPFKETLSAHCRPGDTTIILSDKFREDFLCVKTDTWVRTLSYSIVNE